LAIRKSSGGIAEFMEGGGGGGGGGGSEVANAVILGLAILEGLKIGLVLFVSLLVTSIISWALLSYYWYYRSFHYHQGSCPLMNMTLDDNENYDNTNNRIIWDMTK
jgi:hypothetical protein